jgi:hypothetical protein
MQTIDLLLLHFKINYSSLCEMLIDFFKALTFNQTFHNELEKSSSAYILNSFAAVLKKLRLQQKIVKRSKC